MPIDRESVLRTAERLLRQGRLEGAIAEYVRLTDDQPRDWNSINTLGDLYVRAGNHERAVAQFVRIGDHLFDEGFLPKAAALYKKALKVKHDHEHTLLRLSSIAVQQGLLADGKLYLRQLSQQRQNRGDQQGAAECVIRLGEVDEDDGDAKAAAAQAAVGLQRVPQAISFLQEAAIAFEKQRRPDDAADALIAAAHLAPDDDSLKTAVARLLMASGQVERAQPFLTAGTIGEDPELLLASARHDITSGRTAAGYAGLMRAIALAPDCHDQVRQLADEFLQSGRIEEAYGCIEVLVDAALFEGAFDRATERLESFLAGQPVIQGLLKLVDVYVDAGLEDRITAVQGRLADAYLDSGRPAEARIVTEDLMARQPDVEAHVHRLRRALVALGVEDIDAVIARQLEATAMFDELIEFTENEVTPDIVEQPRFEAVPAEPDFEDREPLPEADPVKPQAVEIDLSNMLTDLKLGSPVEQRPASLAVSAPVSASDPAALFEEAQEHLRRGAPTQAAFALQAAARSPQLQFRAAAQLGRLAMSRGDLHGAVEWLEQAASAPAPTPGDTFGVIYELADTLEQAGEQMRALAVFMELEADAGHFKDVRARIDRLTAATGGHGEPT